MIWPFRTRCPLNVYEKVWIEQLLAALAVEFGIDRLLTGQDVFDASRRIFAEGETDESDTPAILSAICERMRFDPNRFTLQPETPEEHQTPVTKGEWEVDDDGRYAVRIKDAEAGGMELQVAILARLVGATLLIERGDFKPNDLKDWWRAELTAVAMGFGPMIANMTLAQVDEHWLHLPKRMFRYGYLPSHVTGYALAVLCWLGGDNDPGCSSKLRRDAANAFRQGLRYLHQTGDCLVQRNDWGRPIEGRDLQVLISDLSSPLDGRRLAALWELTDRDADVSSAVAPVAARLQDGNPAIRLNAAVTLGKWRADARAALPELRHAIGSDREDRNCAQAARAVGVISEAADVTATERDGLLDELTHLRETTRNPQVRDAVDEAMSRLGAEPAVIGPNLAKGIRDAIAAVADGRLRKLLECVRRVEPDVERFLQEYFSDPEVLARARSVLRQMKTPDPYAGLPEWTGGSIMTNWRWM
jgi:hypothetical protein